MTLFTELPPLSLYIHIPWCVRKCPYCDFNSHEQKSDIDEERYIQALINDLTLQLPSVWGRRLHSIFIGGGTPSLFSAKSFDSLLSQIRALIPFQGEIEITMEANPGTAEAQKFKDFFSAGINRLSIGAQSLNKDHLRRLGRIHSGDEALKAITFAQDAGFNKINVDLMHGLPMQTIEEALSDLHQIISTGVSHLSWYQLTLEPNTLFYQHPPKLPNEDTLFDIQDEGERVLLSNGLKQYEVSAYSKSNRTQCLHNRNYWEFGDYLAIGAGAHGKITHPEQSEIVRYSQKRHPKRYLEDSVNYTETSEKINENELPFEFMLNTLRLKEGVPSSFFERRTGLPLQSIDRQLNRAKEKGLLEDSLTTIKPTVQGSRFLNDLLSIFMETQQAIPIKTL